MALNVVQFVDSVQVSPTVRLDLNNENPWAAPYEGADLSPPRLRRAVAQTLLRDGARHPASAYDDRVLKLRLELQTSTVDGQAAALQALAREVDRPTNFLRYQPAGMTHPVFFRTKRSDLARIVDYPGAGTFRTVDVELLSDPFALGLPETLTPVIISNDPADRFPANANPYFETDASSWTPSGGTFARSTAQFHQGVASGLLTPDGVSATVIVRSELVTNLLETFDYRASAWVRCAASRNVVIGIDWHDHTGAFVSSSTASVAVTADTWTFLQVVGSAPTVGGPADLPQAKLTVSMTGTPLASHLLYVDEAKFRDQESGNGPGGLCWDVTGVKGDVETPPVLVLESTTWAADRQILLAVRRRDSTNVPLVLQGEDFVSGSLGPDTTSQSGDTAMSKGGYLRTTFAGTPTMTTRWTAFFGSFSSANTRGRYRVFARYRKTVASDVIRVQLRWAAGKVTNPPVTLPTSTDIRYVDLGVFHHPPFNDPVVHPLTGGPVSVGAAFLDVQEARDSGTGNLDIDCLVIVPVGGPVTDPGSERMALVTVGGSPATVDAVGELIYYWGLFGDISVGGPQPAAGMYPLLNPGTNRLYLMANAGLIGPADSLLDTTTVTISYNPRYLNVRPAST